MNRWTLIAAGIVSATYCMSAAAQLIAATAPTQGEVQGGLAEIVVTAEKRSESINDVPITVTALSESDVAKLGITDPGELAKVTPSLVAAKSAWGVPVYSLRGVGFYDNSLSAVPAVTIYVDEVPLPFSTLGSFTSLDVERIEVLKGPQGTLYGENSTGGAINYLANKPTDTFHSGGELSYGRFNDLDVSGFVSGPLTDTLLARLSAHKETADPWQHSLTRPNDRLGAKDISNARLLLEWKPRSDLTMMLNLNIGEDRSEPQAPQFQGINPENAFALFVDGTFHPALLHYPSFGNNAFNADWNANSRFQFHVDQDQGVLTIDYDPSDAIGLKSITSYIYYHQNNLVDSDGTYLSDLQQNDYGKVSTLYQELRLHGNAFNDLKWIVGANFEKSQVIENTSADISEGYEGCCIVGFGKNDDFSDLSTKTKAAYGNLDFDLTHGLSMTTGVRYTKKDFEFATCTIPLDQTTVNAVFNAIGNHVPIGSCFTLLPNRTSGLYTPPNLSQSNTAWRVGLNEKLNHDTLLYVSASKGFKGGTYPNISAGSYKQDVLVNQESVLTYEAGFKATLDDNRMQLNGAVFYYDYRNKQVLGGVHIPEFFGDPAFPALVNVPKSYIKGAELQYIVSPLTGLTMDFETTYLDTKITGHFFNTDIAGVDRELAGYSLPFSPKWSAVVRADYTHPLTNDYSAYYGALWHYQAASNSSLGGVQFADLPSYGTVDLQAGIEKGNLRVGLWGRNVLNKYYWTNVYLLLDAIDRFAGIPATYGVSVSYKY